MSCPHCGGEVGLAGAAEGADYLGVRVPNLRKMPGLPRAAEIRSGPVWVVDDLRGYKRGSKKPKK